MRIIQSHNTEEILCPLDKFDCVTYKCAKWEWADAIDRDIEPEIARYLPRIITKKSDKEGYCGL